MEPPRGASRSRTRRRARAWARVRHRSRSARRETARPTASARSCTLATAVRTPPVRPASRRASARFRAVAARAPRSPAGSHSRVTATSKDGERTTVTAHYRVRNSTSFKVTRVKGHRNGHVTLRIGTSGPGVVNVLVTDWLDNLAHTANVTLLAPAPHRFVWARAHLVARRQARRHVPAQACAQPPRTADRDAPALQGEGARVGHVQRARRPPAEGRVQGHPARAVAGHDRAALRSAR